MNSLTRGSAARLSLSLGVAALATGAIGAPMACSQGEPAFTGQDGSTNFDAGGPVQTEDAETERGLPEASVLLEGRVLDPTDQPIVGAIVAIEVGGLDQVNPGAVAADGSLVPSVTIDPFYQYGALTDETGSFGLFVPNEPLGVHVYAAGYLCGVPDGGALEAGTRAVTIRPDPATEVEGGITGAPTVTGLTVAPQVSQPDYGVQLSALVQAADPTHPLSEQVLAVEPTTHFAGIFAPPTRGVPGGAYPDGVYGRLVTAPSDTGAYTFHMVAATTDCIVSRPVRQTLYVTDSGTIDGAILEDAGFDAGLGDATMDATSDADAVSPDASGG